MKVIIYGDFSCPYSYLASQRADRLRNAGRAEPEWRAVEHDHAFPHTGRPADTAAAGGELARVAALALPGEHAPAAAPPLVSNTEAAVAAYAEAVPDGFADALRRRLFEAIWAEGQHLSSAYAVRGLVAVLRWPPASLALSLGCPDLPSPLNRRPSPGEAVRRSGAVIAPDGGPLTTAAWRRIRQWRAGWLARTPGVVPLVIGPDGAAYPGVAGLEFLASLAGGPQQARPAAELAAA